MAAKRNFRLMAGGKNEKKKKAGRGKGRGIVVLAVAAALFALLLVAFFFVAARYQVKNITVEGNLHYTDEEITGMVLKDRLSYNSLYLSLRYQNREITDIPFIQTMTVKVLSPDTIRIMVYEKTVAGYVEYMGRYLYFDRDGIVVESSETRTRGVPQVTGIAFDHVVLYEPLPVEDDTVFQKILSITQMLSKYEISTDKIYFNESGEITLYFENVRVRLGTDAVEEKVMQLKYILPRLEGKSGVLRMENYTEERENISFQEDR